LNDITRQDLSGSFIELTEGVTHYELNNPEKENTMILVHGESVPFFIYDPTFEFLAGSGFRNEAMQGRLFNAMPTTMQ
jgi:hypothetical protein